MISALGILKGLLALAGAVAKYMADRQLIEAGEAKAIAQGLKGANNATKRVDAARHKFRTNAEYREQVRKTYTKE